MSTTTSKPNLATRSNDSAAVEQLTRTLHLEMKPTTELQRFLVERTALLMIRLRHAALSPQVVINSRGDLDSSPEAVLAWKFEQAAELSLHRTLKALDESKAAADPLVATRYKAQVCKELASSLKTTSNLQPSTPRPLIGSASTTMPFEDSFDYFSQTSHAHKRVANEVPFAIGKKP